MTDYAYAPVPREERISAYTCVRNAQQAVDSDDMARLNHWLARLPEGGEARWIGQAILGDLLDVAQCLDPKFDHDMRVAGEVAAKVANSAAFHYSQADMDEDVYKKNEKRALGLFIKSFDTLLKLQAYNSLAKIFYAAKNVDGPVFSREVNLHAIRRRAGLTKDQREKYDAAMSAQAMAHAEKRSNLVLFPVRRTLKGRLLSPEA